MLLWEDTERSTQKFCYLWPHCRRPWRAGWCRGRAHSQASVPTQWAGTCPNRPQTRLILPTHSCIENSASLAPEFLLLLSLMSSNPLLHLPSLWKSLKGRSDSSPSGPEHVKSPDQKGLHADESKLNLHNKNTHRENGLSTFPRPPLQASTWNFVIFNMQGMWALPCPKTNSMAYLCPGVK